MFLISLFFAIALGSVDYNTEIQRIDEGALENSLLTQVLVTFQVDMSSEVVSENGVHLAGSNADFTDFGFDLDGNLLDPWLIDGIDLYDENEDNIYEVTLSLLANTTYQYKFVNGNTWGQDESNNRLYTTSESDSILDAVCFNSTESCESFNGTELNSLTFRTNLSNAISDNSFSSDDLLIVRWGYGGTQLVEKTDTLSLQGFGTEYVIEIQTPEVNLDEGLYYQFYKIVDNIQYREVYFNFDYNGEDQNLAERRYVSFEGVESNQSIFIEDVVSSNVDARRRPIFINTNQIGQEITVLWEVDMRPAYYQVYAGTILQDIQGDVDVSIPSQVYDSGIWINGPATVPANGEDWTSWGAGLVNTIEKRMWDDGTHGDQVEGDNIYSVELTYDENSTYGQEFKFSIGGGDNESAYGLNHIANIDIASPTIRSYWGSINPLFYDSWDYDLNEPTIDICGGFPGDINLDESIDVLDIVGIVNYITGVSDLDEQSLCNADFNGDSSTDVLDIVNIVNLILSN